MEQNRDRECGKCGLCCTALGVVVLEKPGGDACPHRSAAGCGIYDTRPDECREFVCGWLWGHGRNAERPDVVGYCMTAVPAFDSTPDRPELPMVLVFEGQKGAATFPSVRSKLRRFARNTLVCVIHRDSRTMYGPARRRAAVQRVVASHLVESETP